MGGGGGAEFRIRNMFCFILRGLDGGSGWGMVADQEPDWIRIRSLLTIFDKQFYNSVKIGPNFFL